MCSIIKTYYSYRDNRKKLQLSYLKYCLCHFIVVEVAQRKVSKVTSIDYLIWKEIKADFANLVFFKKKGYLLAVLNPTLQVSFNQYLSALLSSLNTVGQYIFSSFFPVWFTIRW